MPFLCGTLSYLSTHSGILMTSHGVLLEWLWVKKRAKAVATMTPVVYLIHLDWWCENGKIGKRPELATKNFDPTTTTTTTIVVWPRDTGLILPLHLYPPLQLLLPLPLSQLYPCHLYHTILLHINSHVSIVYLFPPLPIHIYIYTYYFVLSSLYHCALLLCCFIL